MLFSAWAVCLGATPTVEPRLRRFPWCHENAPPRAHNLVVLSWTRNRFNDAKFAGALVSRLDSTGNRPMQLRGRGHRWAEVMPDTNSTDPKERFLGIHGSDLPHWPPGVSVDRQIVFADLPPGRYEITRLCFGPESHEKAAFRRGTLNFAWLGMSWMDADSSRSQRTFTVGESSFVYLGELRHIARPLSDRARMEWSAGDEAAALERLADEEDLAPWQDLIAARVALLAARRAPAGPAR